MPQRSAGLLVFRHIQGLPEFLLVHPGGPFFTRKDAGAWSIPKGLVEDGEDPLQAARRETAEETGLSPPGPFVQLGEYRQPGGKRVAAWSAHVGADASPMINPSNSFSMEWPPRSGRVQVFPEVDRAEWFSLDVARVKILNGQRPILDDFLLLRGTQPAED